MAAAKSKRKLVAQRQFVAEIDGKQVVVLQGARFAANDPIVVAHKEHFAAKEAAA